MTPYWLILILCIVSAVTAQILKYLLKLIINKKSDFTLLFTTGNMPSSHSALVSTLAMSVLIYENYQVTLSFVITFVLAAIVIHDAFGVRYESGKHAILLNEIKGKLNMVEDYSFTEKKLKESLGHKPFEVFVGVTLGVAIALVGFAIYN